MTKKDWLLKKSSKNVENYKYFNDLISYIGIPPILDKNGNAKVQYIPVCEEDKEPVIDINSTNIVTCRKKPKRKLETTYDNNTPTQKITRDQSLFLEWNDAFDLIKKDGIEKKETSKPVQPEQTTSKLEPIPLQEKRMIMFYTVNVLLSSKEMENVPLYKNNNNEILYYMQDVDTSVFLAAVCRVGIWYCLKNFSVPQWEIITRVLYYYDFIRQRYFSIETKEVDKLHDKFVDNAFDVFKKSKMKGMDCILENYLKLYEDYLMQDIDEENQKLNPSGEVNEYENLTEYFNIFN